MARNRISVMHGVNMNALDRRSTEHYGDLTFTKLETRIDEFARDLGLSARFFQTNAEGEFVEELHRAAEYADGLILNPGAWTHYSYAIRDALELTGLPAVEVHISDVDAREAFRKVSVIRDLCIGTVKGRGVDGYQEALELLMGRLG